MKKNMGILDRWLRVVLAVIVGILYFRHMITGIGAIVLGIVAVVFLATSGVGFCPVYKLLGISTLAEETHHKPA